MAPPYPNGRAGLRLNGLFTQRLLDDVAGDYNVYAADLDLLFRLLPVDPDRVFAPFIALGGGATAYASVSGSPTLADGTYGEDPVTKPHAFASLGVDILAGRRLGLRFEVADKMVFPAVGESPPSTGLPVTHNGIALIGLQLQLGTPPRAARREPVPTPAPLPPDTSPRVTPPEPRIETAPVGLYTVEYDTFVEAATAVKWARRLRARGVPVWLLNSEIRGERVSRVRIGALTSEMEARTLARRIEREYDWPVSVDAIGADEPYPDDAVAATRAFLRGN